MIVEFVDPVGLDHRFDLVQPVDLRRVRPPQPDASRVLRRHLKLAVWVAETDLLRVKHFQWDRHAEIVIHPQVVHADRRIAQDHVDGVFSDREAALVDERRPHSPLALYPLIQVSDLCPPEHVLLQHEPCRVLLMLADASQQALVASEEISQIVGCRHSGDYRSRLEFVPVTIIPNYAVNHHSPGFYPRSKGAMQTASQAACGLGKRQLAEQAACVFGGFRIYELWKPGFPQAQAGEQGFPCSPACLPEG